MPKAGTYTALQQLEPYQEDTPEKVMQAFEFGKGIADEARAQEADRKAAQKKQKEDLVKKFKTDYGTLFHVVTKTKSIDEAFIRGVNGAMNMMGDIYKDIESNPALANEIGTQTKIQNLKNFSKNLKLISDRYTVYADYVGKGMKEGKLSNWNTRTLSDLNSIFVQANLDVKVDEETGLPIAVIAELGKDDKPTGRLKELNLLEVLDGRGLNDTVETFDFQESVTKIGTKAGDRSKTTPSGFSYTEKQQFSTIEPEIRNMVKGFLGTPDNPTDVAKSIWADTMGLSPKDLTSTDMKRIEDYYVKSIGTFYDEKNKTVIQHGARTAAQKEKRIATGKGKKAGYGIELRTDTEGNPIEASPTGVYGDIGGGGYSFTLPEDITLGPKGSKQLIDMLYLTNAGKIAYEGTEFIGKKTGQPIDPANRFSGKFSGEQVIERFVGGGLNDTQLNRIARDLVLRNAAELKKTLEDARDKYTAPTNAPFTDTTQPTTTPTIDTSKYN